MKTRSSLFYFLLCCFVCHYSQTLQAQTVLPQQYIDSTCQVFLSLDDTVSATPISHSAPYLFSVNGRHFNNNFVATTNFDASTFDNGTYVITITDGFQNTYTDTLRINCGNTPSSPPSVFLQDSSSTNASFCGLCDGSASVYIQNIPASTPVTFFVENDTFINSFNNLSLTNLCAGNYNIRAVDSSGNIYNNTLQINCPTSVSTANCFGNGYINLGLDQAGQLLLTPSLIGFASSSGQSLLIDEDNQLQSNIPYTCQDLGFHSISLIVFDSFQNTFDSCHVLVQITDSLSACNGQGYTITDSTTAASNCAICDADYNFRGVQLTANGQLPPAPYAYMWSDGATTANRTDLCPTRPYRFTVFDANGVGYSSQMTPDCPLTIANSCIDLSLIDSSMAIPNTYAPVCGCNGVTYNNAAEARFLYGIDNWQSGICSQTNPPILITSNTIPSSFGCDTSVIACNGRINISVSNINPPYSIVWADSAAFGFNPTNLCAGAYIATITDGIGNSSTRSFLVGTDGCVWPGDTDENGIANNFDLLPIGLAYGTIGNARNTQGIAWQGYSAFDWFVTNPIAGLSNYKHMDCDGNAVIDSSDINAIDQNYGQSYARQANNSLLGTIPLFVQSTRAIPGDTITLDVHLGEQSNPVVDAYGVAFTIQYDPAVIANLNNIEFDFSNSWLGNDLIAVQKNFHNQGELEIGISRRDGTPITNFGVLGQVSFTIRDDLVMSRSNNTDTTITTPVTIGGIRLINHQNIEIGTYPTTGILLLQDSSTFMNIIPTEAAKAGIVVFPNPTTGMLSISSNQEALQSIAIQTVTGQLVKQINNVQSFQHQISLTDLPNGIYILQLKTAAGNYFQKVHLQR